MRRNRQQCPCGSGKNMRRCCGAPSSQRKLELEASARRLSEMGMHAEAAQALSERARLSPQNPMVWNDLGVEHVAARQLEDAYEAFTRALCAVPDYTPSLYNLGRMAMDHCVAEKAKEHPVEDRTRAFASEAIRYLEASLYKDSLDHLSHAALSAAYTYIGDTVRAQLHLRKGSKLNPAEMTQSKRTLLEQLVFRVLAKSKSEPLLPFLFSTGKEFHSE